VYHFKNFILVVLDLLLFSHQILVLVNLEYLKISPIMNISVPTPVYVPLYRFSREIPTSFKFASKETATLCQARALNRQGIFLFTVEIKEANGSRMWQVSGELFQGAQVISD
jgi:hypothetical protein